MEHTSPAVSKYFKTCMSDLQEKFSPVIAKLVVQLVARHRLIDMGIRVW